MVNIGLYIGPDGLNRASWPYIQGPGYISRVLGTSRYLQVQGPGYLRSLKQGQIEGPRYLKYRVPGTKI